jgi:hypothetical protein
MAINSKSVADKTAEKQRSYKLSVKEWVEKTNARRMHTLTPRTAKQLPGGSE